MKDKKQTIAAVLKRIEKVEQELREIRNDIAECLTPTATTNQENDKDDEPSFTLDDLCEAFGNKHKSYAVRLRHALEEQGITTFADFIAMTPGQLLDLDGIGPGTLEYTNKAMKRLGIRW